MKILRLLLLTAVAAGFVFAGDSPAPAPEIGLDATTVVSAIGIAAGGLLIIRARRKK